MLDVKNSIMAVLFICLAFELTAEGKWAVVIGISEYPKMGKSFPNVVDAVADAKKISKALTGPRSKFPKDHVYLLAGKNARSDWVREVIFHKLSCSKPDDLVVFFFAGHAYWDPEFKRLYLLFYDSGSELIDTTAIPLDQLAYFFQTYVPARNIMICLDARHSRQGLGNSWRLSRGWAGSEKQILVLESSASGEVFGHGRSKGDFADFFVDSLNGRPFLGQSADLDGDGLITVTEHAKHISLAMRLSGVSHPVYWGESDSVLASAFLGAHIQLVDPSLRVGPQREQRLAGFLRSDFPLKKMKIAGVSARFGLLSSRQARKYGLIPWQYSYWFLAKQSIAPGQSVLNVQLSGDDKSFSTMLPLRWSYPGWHGEWMPPGLKKGDSKGVYLWKKDGSEMVYISPGTSLMGMPDSEASKIAFRLKRLREYLQEQRDWLDDDRALREIFIDGLEESNATLSGVARKLKIIYDQVELFQKVNSRVISEKKAKNREIAKPESPTSLLEEQLFTALSEKLILRCYRDIRTITLKKNELDEDIVYLDTLIAADNLQIQWPRKKIDLPGFYIDRYELSNSQYRKFCDATQRPYPPAPWWNEDYFFTRPKHPVVNVSWEDAMAYGRWVGKNLPSSAQWEKSACGDKGWTYPWGKREPNQALVNADVPPDLSSQSELQLPRLMPVAVNSSYSSSPYGCYHMAGNVREWCLDAPGARSPVKKFSDSRISKGGAFSGCSIMLCNWFSYPVPMVTRRCDLGFRCSLDFVLRKKIR